MIKKISFSNYKAFECGEIELRPLTFFMGANSSGKSSLLHLQLLLSQTISLQTAYSSALRTNGQYIGMGEDINIFKDHDSTHDLRLSFDVDADTLVHTIIDFESSNKFIPAEWLKYLQSTCYEEFNRYLIAVKSELQERRSAKNGNRLSKMIVDSMYDALEKLEAKDKLDWDEFYLELQYLELKSLNELKDQLTPCLRSCKAIVEDFKPNENVCIDYRFGIDEYSGRVRIKTCEIRIRNMVLIGLKNSKRGVTSVYSDILDVKFQDLLDKYPLTLEFNSLELVDMGKFCSPVQEFVKTLFRGAYRQVAKQYNRDNVVYIGPLRANPERYYFLDDSERSLDLNCKDANSMATILKNQSFIKDKINSWLARFELSVDVKLFKDVINNVIVTQNSQMLDLTDVGFGISQVLPILIAGFNGKNEALTIMEQPEIHLHPKMQAELADLFIDIIKSSKLDDKIRRCLLIETHSEYILKRIRRRIAERSLSPDDVAIYFIDPRNSESPQTATIRRVDIAENGFIEWPRDFYETEMNDDLAFFMRS